MNKSSRYQYQPWYVKLYRRGRYQWRVPYRACNLWWGPSHPDFRLSFREAWRLAVSLTHADMNWVYDWDEIKKRRIKTYPTYKLPPK